MNLPVVSSAPSPPCSLRVRLLTKGRWLVASADLGFAMDWQIPVARGFNASFGFLGGGEDHISQYGMLAEWGCHGTDLWSSHGPATGRNGTYSGYIYNDAAVAVIEHHPEPDTNPLFIYLATQTMHAPLEVPSCFSDLYPNTTYTDHYAVSQGMATVSDSVLANVTDILKERGMWKNTLVVHLSDVSLSICHPCLPTCLPACLPVCLPAARLRCASFDMGNSATD